MISQIGNLVISERTRNQLVTLQLPVSIWGVNHKKQQGNKTEKKIKRNKTKLIKRDSIDVAN